MIETKLLPLDRFINPKRAAFVSLFQTVFSLIIFLLVFFAGAALSLWPSPPFVNGMPDPARAGLIGSALLTLVVIRLIRRGLPNHLFPDYRRAELLMMTRQYAAAKEPLKRQIEAIRANPLADKNRTLLLLDYSEYGYEESALVMLALLEAGFGDPIEAQRLLTEAKTLNSGNLLVDSFLADMEATEKKARDLVAYDGS